MAIPAAGGDPHWTTRWWFLLPTTLVNIALGAWTMAGALYVLLGMRIEVLTGTSFPRTTTELVFSAFFTLVGIWLIVAAIAFWTRHRAAFARVACMGLAAMSATLAWELAHEVAATGRIELYPLRAWEAVVLAGTPACLMLARHWRKAR